MPFPLSNSVKALKRSKKKCREQEKLHNSRGVHGNSALGVSVQQSVMWRIFTMCDLYAWNESMMCGDSGKCKGVEMTQAKWDESAEETDQVDVDKVTEEVYFWEMMINREVNDLWFSKSSFCWWSNNRQQTMSKYCDRAEQRSHFTENFISKRKKPIFNSHLR